MIRTVFPRSTSRCSTASNFRTSSKCSPGCRLIQYIDCSPGLPFGELACELDSLRLATGKSRRGLTQLNVAQPDFDNQSESFC